MTATVVKLGVRFAGRCVVCGRHTGDRPFEMEDTLLVLVEGKHRVAHPSCAGGATKGRVQGGRAYAGPETFEVTP